MSEETDYDALRKRSETVANLQSTLALLGWDQETNLPARAGDYRAEQIAQLSAMAHAMWVAPETGEWLAACEAGGLPEGSVERANVREWRRQYDRSAKLPERLVRELSRECSLSQQAWIAARKASDFSLFAPHLGRVVALVREVADHIGYERQPYDALLDEYEPGQDTAATGELFDALGPRLAELVIEGEEMSKSRPGHLPDGPYPVDAQRAFNIEVAKAFGFDFEAGRLDTAPHPFCSGLGPRDTRLTTRYDESDFTNALYCVLHETGHGLYEQGLDAAAYGTPAGMASSLGIHESQSRLWENHVARSPAFWAYWLPRAARHFPVLRDAAADALTDRVNRCRRSFIRVDADELSYDLHIILRFRIETAVINERLPVADIPAVWNDEFKRLFSLDVPDDARGCLQDIHWSHGAFGYFPTYTLGNLNAAQLMHTARRAIGDLDASLAAGEYAPLLDWLRDRIHRHGRSLPPRELMRAATGSDLSPDFHLAHLRGKLDPGHPTA